MTSDVWHIVYQSSTLVTNEVVNPSVEINTQGYSGQAGLTLTRVTTVVYSGEYGLECVSPSPTSYLHWGPASVNGVYTLSCMFKGTKNKIYRLMFITSGQSWYQDTVATGEWQQLTVTGTAVSSVSGALYALQSPDTFYTDGWMLTAGSDVYEYFDGSYDHAQWQSNAHNSRSIGYPRKIVGFSSIGFNVSLGAGSGFAPVQNYSLPYGLIDGSHYERTTMQSRTLTLIGTCGASTLRDFKELRRRIGSYFYPGKPVTIRYTGGSKPLEIKGYYQDGWGLTQMVGFGESTGITFFCPDPYWIYPYQRVSPSQPGTVTISNVNNVAQRVNGIWSRMGTIGGTVRVLEYGPDKRLYAGGQFSGGIAVWNVVTSQWNLVGGGVNSSVDAIVFDSEGNLYIGGAFTQAGGSVTTNRIAKYTFATQTWSTFGNGFANGVVYALGFDRKGTLYAGGTFTSPINRLACWRYGSWWDVGEYGETVENDVFDIQCGPDNRIYFAGAFSFMSDDKPVNRIAFLNEETSKLQGLGNGVDNTVYKIRFGSDGRLYACGDFNTAGGVNASKVAVWNGIQWSSLGKGMNNQVRALHVSLDGIVYAGGTFTVVDGFTIPNGLAFWSGSAWFPVDIKLPTGSQIYSFIERDNVLTIGFTTVGTGVCASSQDIVYTGTTSTYPILIITSTTYANIYQIINWKNNARLFFNFEIFPQETITIDLEKRSIVSSWRGMIPWVIRPGSTPTKWKLEPGEYGSTGINRVTFYASNNGPSLKLVWTERYVSNDV